MDEKLKGLEPYFIEIAEAGCKTCQAGRQWDVIGPNGDAQSQTWGDEEEAQFFADCMNDAYASGRAALTSAVAPTLTEEQLRELASYIALRLPEELPLRGNRSEAEKVVRRLIAAALSTAQPPAREPTLTEEEINAPAPGSERDALYFPTAPEEEK